MRAAATELNFEDAARYRDRIDEIRKSLNKEE
jgi:excinuclease ABC subunit B